MNKIQNIILSIFIIAISFTFQSCNGQQKTEKSTINEQKNVLFIIVDDLRTQLNIYGETQMITPNIDKLASEGITFNRAYCNVPVCGASRASLQTGKRPTNDRFLDYGSRIDVDMPNVPTLGKQFRDNGYTTISNSKISHHEGDAKGTWTEEWWPKKQPKNGWRDYITEENITLLKNDQHGNPYEKPDVKDDAYFDGKTANKSISDLKKLKKSGKPFFLAVGFVKPHLPFNAPKKYWDLYDSNKINLPENAIFPASAPQIANHGWGELRYYKGIPKTGAVSDEMAINLIHGYYASVSYIDAQIGKVLKSLDDLGLRKNTIVVLVGDHGWSLSEHGLWVKHSNFEVALQVPLVISTPDFPTNKKTNSVAELIDLYPTICQLANVPIPSHVDGKSLEESLKNPSKIYNNTAWAKWHTGETLIADNYFYTEWHKNGKTTDVMLYDHNLDPNETKNLAKDPAYKHTVDSLSVVLNKKVNTYYKSESKK